MRIAYIISILLLSNLFSDCYAQGKTDNRGFIVEIGDKAPDIKFHLINGDSTSISELKGKVIVLQFTASWCSVCRKEMPHLEKEVWQNFKDDEFILIGVDYDEPLEKVIRFKQDMKTTYPMALDPGAKIFNLFAREKVGVTRNIVIDQNGHIAFMTRLFDEKEFEGMVLKIESLLKK